MQPRALALVGVFIAACAVLLALRSSNTLHPSLPKARAEASALRDPRVRAFLKHERSTDIRALPLDQTHWRVTVFDHGKSVLDASVTPSGHVDALQLHPPGVHAAGSDIAWSRWVLFGLTVLFVMATAVVPIASVRNLDVLAICAGVLATLLFYDARFVAGDTWAGAALLLYLGVRCALVGRRERPQPHVQRPLHALLLERVAPASRRRIPVVIVAALVLASAGITYTSAGISDVAFAGMAGATAIQRGHVPYGHITREVVHGDTYPPFTYVMYLPFSLASPVDNSFDDLQGALDLNAITLIAGALCAFAIGTALARERAPAEAADPRAGGLALAVAWLSCPAILLAASGGGNDVPTGFLVMASVALTARAASSGALMALATAAKVGPVGALLAWLAAGRRRERGRILAVSVLVAVALLAALVALGGVQALTQMTHALGFQFKRGSFHAIWTQIDSRAAQAIFQAVVLTFALWAVVSLATARSRPSLRRTCALAAAILLGLQLAANYWTYAYLAWVLPLILVALFPPVRPGSPSPARAAP